MDGTIGVILSGGQSRRMGRDKAGVMLAGRTLLDRMAAELAPLFGEVYVSVDRPGRYPGYRELADLRPGQGPLAGLEAAFLRTGAEAVFLAAVDLPFAGASLAARILAEAGAADACVIRRRSGEAEPLFALYRRGCLEPLTACLNEGRRAVKALLDRVDCRWLEEDDLPELDLERALWNVNTGAELCRAAEAAGEK
ncbi:molybdenum cofactor guanylyltransferase [uncultured Flavonifractor sp.]|uniref:Probable molybdenum cofactor guanylyltransferase n=1 Tax=Candidatus Flavonifractor intestinigallinarum TaxID=2838586 RepID=A0A9D2MK40_9FIRM|nr:molybdenum cofactor guanylyltransferase [uncultured Flavonifractor sp.]HJB79875.1 molybdenum cofactor guanylyltransferase [Candidatus Flavonifractor intestinigallinarum]